jgi:hypothetical protein
MATSRRRTGLFEGTLATRACLMSTPSWTLWATLAIIALINAIVVSYRYVVSVDDVYDVLDTFAEVYDIAMDGLSKVT